MDSDCESSSEHQRAAVCALPEPEVKKHDVQTWYKSSVGTVRDWHVVM